MNDDESLPEYAFVPGGAWPRPSERSSPARPLNDPTGEGRKALVLGGRLFNAGYYWEAHEVWESLWHAERRQGPVADLLKAIIKLAAAGVKVREKQPHGVAVHALRAAVLIENARESVGNHWYGHDLTELAEFAREAAAHPPTDQSGGFERAVIVFKYNFKFETNP